jgi:molybdenum cofactor biosynthesis enzyme MoaA
LIAFQTPELLNKIGLLNSLGSSILRRKLAFIPFAIWATNRCNSRCFICNIWKKEPKTDLPAETIRKILNDRAITNNTFFLLTGGELLLHPELEEILFLFRGHNYVVLTNALMVERLTEVVRKCHVKRVSISLDGSEETYKKVRGVDGYSSVERAVRELRHDTLVRIDYVISPWNSRKDLIHVMKFCEKYQIELGAEYYTDMEYLEIDRPPGRLYDVSDLIDHPYHRLYPEWVEGNLKMPCLSIFARPSVRQIGRASCRERV